MKLKKEKLIIALLCILIIFALAVIGALALNGGREKNTAAEAEPPVKGYEANVVLDDPDTLQDMVDEMVEKTREGQMALEMQVIAGSADGESFSCYLANAKENNYDMYLTLYLDETGEELYRSGLIPVGGRLETFQSSRKLVPGTHTCTLVYHQVESDGETEHAQVNVGLDLIVGE